METVSTLQTPYLREVSQHLRHLVSSLSATHIDDDVAVGVLGQGLRDDSFATAKGSRDGSGSSLHTSERMKVDNPEMVLKILGERGGGEGRSAGKGHNPLSVTKAKAKKNKKKSKHFSVL